MDKKVEQRAPVHVPEAVPQLSHDALADAKQANGDTYRRILASWQEYDACLRKISAVCWTDNDAFDERDCAANIIRHIRDLQRRVKQIETGNHASSSEIGSVPSDSAEEPD